MTPSLKRSFRPSPRGQTPPSLRLFSQCVRTIELFVRYEEACLLVVIILSFFITLEVPVLVTSLFTITIVLLYEYCTVLFVSSVAFDSQANSQEFAVSKNCQTQTFEPAAHLPTGTGRIDHAERRNVAWTAVSFPGRLRLSIQPHD